MDPEIIITHVASSSLAGQEQRFWKPLVTIGRSEDNDVHFDYDEDLLVSHRHAELYVEDGALYLCDLGSRNGTYVNHRLISATVKLNPDDAIHFGDAGPQMKARLGEPEAASGSLGLRQSLLGHFFPKEEPQAEGTAAPPQPQEPAPQPQDAVPAEELARTPIEDAPTPPPAPAAAPTPETEDSPPAHEDRGQWKSATPRPAPKASRPLAWLLRLFTVAIAFGFGVAVGYLYLPSLIDGNSDKDTGAPADVASTQYVAALGRLEPDGGILSIGGPAGQTLKSLLVEEGQSVSRDEPLAHLSSYDLLQAEVGRARSAVADAKEQLTTTDAYSAALVEEAMTAVEQMGKPLDLEVQTLEAEVKLLRAHLDIAVKDRERLEKSNQNSSDQLSRQKLVEQRAQRDLTAAEKRLEQLRESAQLRRAQSQAQLQTAIANQKRLKQSIPVETAEKSLTQAEAQLDQAIIRAPRDGKVLKILAREGAALGGQAILQLGDSRRMNVIAEVYETDVRYVHQGQTATISSAALPEELHGTVEKVLWTIERNTIRDLNPTAPEDLRVVEVEIRLDEEGVTKHHDLLEKLINLQVHVRIKKD